MPNNYKIVNSKIIEQMSDVEFNEFSKLQLRAIKSRKVNKTTREKLVAELSSKENYIQTLLDRESLQLFMDTGHRLQKEEIWDEYFRIRNVAEEK